MRHPARRGTRTANTAAPVRHVCVVGSGTRFLSGISYYTRHLAVSLAGRVQVSVILMRGLIPRLLYPGRDRVGHDLTALAYPVEIDVFDGVDWYWFPSMLIALRFLLRHRPSHVVFEWWTGAVLHSFLLLSVVSRLIGARIVVEFHEVQDPGESKFIAARWYVQTFAGAFMRLADAFVIHSEFDRPQLERRYRIGDRPVSVIHHGPFDHHDLELASPRREAPSGTFNFLFFGTIRPYKGLEDLVRAFEALCEAGGHDCWLTVVGETWEGWTLPAELIRDSPHRDRITFVNRYVPDAELDQWFAGADAVVLPYKRSSASGPLHVSMSAGLPTVVTAVGGLPEAAAEYDGAVFVASGDPVDLRRGLEQAVAMRGQRFDDPHSWDQTASLLLDLAARTEPAHARG